MHGLLSVCCTSSPARTSTIVSGAAAAGIAVRQNKNTIRERKRMTTSGIKKVWTTERRPRKQRSYRPTCGANGGETALFAVDSYAIRSPLVAEEVAFRNERRKQLPRMLSPPPTDIERFQATVSPPLPTGSEPPNYARQF